MVLSIVCQLQVVLQRYTNIKSLDIKNDEIIWPSLTFIAPANMSLSGQS